MPPFSSCSLSQTSYETLQTVYNSLNGENWTYRNLSFQWSFPAPYSSPCAIPWQGLSCTKTCVVDGLRLDRMNLSGTIPAQISDLSQLKFISMVANSISGTLPHSVSNLTSLTSLFLSYNDFTNTIPSIWSELQAIRSLDISRTSISGTLPDSWSALSALEILYLDSNLLTGQLPDSWSALSAVHLLGLHYNFLSGTLPRAWSVLSNVNVLLLNYNLFSSYLPRSWSALSSIEQLGLDFNSFIGTIPMSWSLLQNLQAISVIRNSLSGNLPKSWSALSLLQIVYVADNMISGILPDSWSSLYSLHYLGLEHNSLSGTLLDSWASMSVEEFIINDNMISGSLPNAWSAMVTIKNLCLSSNSLTGSLPVVWSTMKSIEYFDIRNNYIHDHIPPEYCSFGDLQVIYLSANQLTGEFDVCWQKLQYIDASQNMISHITISSSRYHNRLENLNISGNSVHQDVDSLSNILTFPLLTSIDLSSNYFTGKLVYYYNNTSDKNFTLLTTIDISNNCMSTEIDDSVCQLTRLTSFVASNLYNSLKCKSRSWISTTFTKHAYPSCVLLMPHMKTVNLAGNALTGSLVDINITSSKLSFVGLVSNRLTGTIPDTWQLFGRFDQLMLSFNKISGVLRPDFVVQKGMTSLNLNINRLSGPLPKSFGTINSSIDVIEGNIISCDSANIYNDGNDVNKATYECGSISLNVMGYVFGISSFCAGICVVALMFKVDSVAKEIKEFKSILKQQLQSNRSIVFVMLVSSLSMLVVVVSLSIVDSSSMYVYEYGWITTAAYTHDWISLIVLIFVFVIMAFMLIVLGLLHSKRLQQDESINSPLRRIFANPILMLKVRGYHFVNVSVIGGLTVVYVLLVLTNSTLLVQILFSMFLGAVKVLWGEFYTPRVYRNALLNTVKETMTPTIVSSLYPVVLRHELVADIWCNILCPLVVILATSSTCYRYVLSGMPSIEFQYPSLTANWIFDTFLAHNSSSVTSTKGTQYQSLVTVTSSVTPIWQYSYECSSAVLASYVSVVYYTYIIYLIPIPLIKLASHLLERWTQGRFTFMHRIFGKLPDYSVETIRNRILRQSLYITSTKHRKHIRHYVMFVVFGLSAPLLGLLIIATTLIDDAMHVWQVSKLREVMINRHRISELDAQILCEGLLFPDISNVYHRYLPWVYLISVGYWSLYAFDAIGDVHGEFVGMVTCLVYMTVSVATIIAIYVWVDRWQAKHAPVEGSQRTISTTGITLIEIVSKIHVKQLQLEVTSNEDMSEE